MRVANMADFLALLDDWSIDHAASVEVAARHYTDDHGEESMFLDVVLLDDDE